MQWAGWGRGTGTVWKAPWVIPVRTPSLAYKSYPPLTIQPDHQLLCEAFPDCRKPQLASPPCGCKVRAIWLAAPGSVLSSCVLSVSSAT